MSGVPPIDPLHGHPHPHHFDPYSLHYHRYRKALMCRRFGVGRRFFWFFLGGFAAAWWMKSSERHKDAWKPCSGTKFGIDRAGWGPGPDGTTACSGRPHHSHWGWRSVDGANSFDVRVDPGDKPIPEDDADRLRNMSKQAPSTDRRSQMADISESALDSVLDNLLSLKSRISHSPDEIERADRFRAELKKSKGSGGKSDGSGSSRVV